MARAKSRILEFLLSHPGATAARIADHLYVTPTAVSAQLKVLREAEIIYYVHPEIRKPARYAIRKARVQECFDSLVDPPPEVRLGKHCTLRYDRDVFEQFRNDFGREHDPVGAGIFDIRSIIHAAVTTDPSLRIVAWSPRFEELVQQTTPNLLDALKDRRLKYVASPDQTSWLGNQSPKPFDWETGAAHQTGNACFGDDGIWAKLLDTGFVDAFSLQANTIDHQPIYLEFYIAPQFTFLGFQSIMMNVRNRVLSVKAENTTNAHYEFFHHEFRQPLQQLRAVETLMHDAIRAGQPGKIRNLVDNISDIADRCDKILEDFPASPELRSVDVPVLAQLLRAAESVAREHRRQSGLTPLPKSIQIPNAARGSDSASYLTTTIPALQYGAFYGFLRNAQTHGHSREGTSIDYREIDGELEIVIVDRGPGLGAEALKSWNRASDTSRGAAVSDLGRYDGLTLAIMGIKTSGGTVRFSPTDNKTGRGVTVTIRVPIKEATLVPVKEAT